MSALGLLRQCYTLLKGAELTMVHEFHRPPYGGGNQFLLALEDELTRGGVRVARNRLTRKTRALLFNSFNFDFDKLRQMRRFGVRMVHRVDGPISVYRGRDDGLDDAICALNNEVADCTIFQSQYSLEKHHSLGLSFQNPCVVPNAANPRIFFPRNSIPLDPSGPIRIVASSWSDNPKKGKDSLLYLDEHLDHSRFSLTFVGRIQAEFRHARHIAAVDSRPLAVLLREQDIYIAASEDDPCSNALIEAMTCGLPVVYRHSGGHPELVGRAGVGYRTQAEIIPAIEEVAANHAHYRNQLQPPSLPAVSARYREILQI